jgi:hypothetical protein
VSRVLAAGALAPNLRKGEEKMNEELLKASISTLKDYRIEVHDKVGERSLKKLDKAIASLEMVLKNNPKSIDQKQVLEIFGTVIKYLPTVVTIIESLRHHK